LDANVRVQLRHPGEGRGPGSLLVIPMELGISDPVIPTSVEMTGMNNEGAV